MKPQEYNAVHHHYITIISPIGFLVELITKSLNSVPVGLLIQRVSSLVCLREKDIGVKALEPKFKTAAKEF